MKTKRTLRARPRGIALMLVMVVVFALTVIIAAFTYSMTVEMKLSQTNNYDTEMEWMGRSGIELARYALATKCPGYEGIDALNQFWAGGTSPCSNDVPPINLKDVPLGHGKISVTITDMERKFDINLLLGGAGPQTEILQKGLMQAGVTDPSQLGTIMDSLMDWVSKSPDPHASGAKDDYYTSLPIPYHCKNGPIDDMTELLLVKGITPDIYWGVTSSNHPPGGYSKKLSVTQAIAQAKNRFSNEQDQNSQPVALIDMFSAMGGKLNINTASAQELQLLPGVDASTAARIVQQRAGPDGVDGTDDDAPFHSLAEIGTLLPPGALAAPGQVPPGPAGGPPQIPGGPAQQGAPGTPPQVPPPPGGAGQGGLSAFCDVRSLVFEVKVVAEINDYKRTFTGIVSRGGQDPSSIQCVRFHWD